MCDSVRVCVTLCVCVCVQKMFNTFHVVGYIRRLMEVNTEVSHSTHHRTHIYYVAPCGRRLVSVTVIVR